MEELILLKIIYRLVFLNEHIQTTNYLSQEKL